MARTLWALVALLGVGAGAPAVSSKPVAGKVIGIVDGDTLSVLVDERELKVRLDGIDAPESGQAMGAAAKQRLAELCFGKECKLLFAGEDRYGRALAKVAAGETYVNRALLSEGLAWHFVRYNRDASFARAQASAMEARRGVWSDPRSVPPWDWREERDAVTDAFGDYQPPPSSAKALPAPSPPPASLQSAETPPRSSEGLASSHWLNTKTGVRHNSSCRHYGTVKNGRPCAADEGRACGLCGG